MGYVVVLAVSAVAEAVMEEAEVEG